MSRKSRKKQSIREERRQRQKKIRRRRRRVLIVEIIILCFLGVAAFCIFKLDKLDFDILDEKNLDVYKDTGPYTNIALFGLDSREGEIDGGVQSDCIMIASINNETQDVKIVSVYRDTLLQQANGAYEKANAAYNIGGAEQAISLLNRNFDLDIKNYVSVNFKVLADVIDLLGGIEVELTDEEVYWTNCYCVETSEVTGKLTEPVKGSGLETLNGVQAVSYARIRYTSGDDFKRTERQRTVLEKVVEKAKSADFQTLNSIIDVVFSQVSTSFSATQLLGIAAHAMEYNIVGMSGFPFEVTTSEQVLEHSGSYVVPVGFSKNIIRLHEFLFDDEEYTPSENVYRIEEDIVYLTGVTEESIPIDTNLKGEDNTQDEE